ncbi:MAG: NlpC/P60 family protein [Pelovirga sp.]
MKRNSVISAATFWPLLLLALLCGGCLGGDRSVTTPGATATDPIADLLGAAAPGESLQRMGYAVQVGAFAQLDNAVALEASLARRGIDAYYFRDDSGLYKVQFGNHGSYTAARDQAERFQGQSLIDSFFIVVPDAYSVARIQRSGRGDLREELVSTARRFLGVPYRWGGEDRGGFDCSGLTMVSYRLNGLDLPRNSRAQFAAGRPVGRTALQQGDLVFFATEGGQRVTHVGLYIGAGQFIHAPRSGQTVRVASLSNSYFQRTYVGARSYL